MIRWNSGSQVPSPLLKILGGIGKLTWVVKYDVDLHASPFELCDYIPGKKKAGILSHSGVDLFIKNMPSTSVHCGVHPGGR